MVTSRRWLSRLWPLVLVALGYWTGRTAGRDAVRTAEALGPAVERMLVWSVARDSLRGRFEARLLHAAGGSPAAWPLCQDPLGRGWLLEDNP